MIGELNVENRVEIDRSEAAKFTFIHESCVFSFIFDNALLSHFNARFLLGTRICEHYISPNSVFTLFLAVKISMESLLIAYILKTRININIFPISGQTKHQNREEPVVRAIQLDKLKRNVGRTSLSVLKLT